VEDGIRDWSVTGVQTCALPIFAVRPALIERPQLRAHCVLSRAFAALHVATILTAETAGEIEPAVVLQRIEADALGLAIVETLAEIGRASCRETEKESGAKALIG